MSYPEFHRFKEHSYLLDADTEELEPWVDRPFLGLNLAMHYNSSVHCLGFLQRLVIGEGNELPFSSTGVRIVTARDGWKEEFAEVYGFPGANGDSDPGSFGQALAVRVPEQAEVFKVYYGSNHGPLDLSRRRIEEAQPLAPDVVSRLESGDFTDEEAEKLAARMHQVFGIYDQLLIAARDPELNPGFAEEANRLFYSRAG